MLKIAFRNIFRQKRRSVLTILTMFGGFTLASISIAWSDGSYAHVINMFTRNQLGHIQVHRQGYLDRPTIYKTIGDHEKAGVSLDTIGGVLSWAPRLYSAGLASVGQKSSAVRVTGIDPRRENATTRFDAKIVSGASLSREPSHEAVLGKGLAKVLQASPGDSVVIVSQGADGSIANDIYRIAGIAKSGDQLSDQITMYLHVEDAQELFVLYGQVHEIVVVCEELDEVDEIAARTEAALGNPELSVDTWKEFAKSFYEAMRADQQGAWIMLFVILLVVAVGVLNTVLMTVLERRREYGVLRAVGTGPWEVFRLVMFEVVLMATGAIIIGIGAAWLVNYLLSIEGVTMPQAFTYGGIEFTKMYTEVNLRSFVWPGVSVILTSLVVTLFPAGKAARVAPARAMRMH